MMIEILQDAYADGLQKLALEISLYQREQHLWKVEKQIANSGGNLCLHLIGNLNAYIGVGLAGSSYIRRRELEFSTKNISRELLVQKINETAIVVSKGLSDLCEDRMQQLFPITIWTKPTTIEYSLVRLLTHLNYHLGQVNYHRRLLDEHEGSTKHRKLIRLWD